MAAAISRKAVEKTDVRLIALIMAFKLVFRAGVEKFEAVFLGNLACNCGEAGIFPGAGLSGVAQGSCEIGAYGLDLDFVWRPGKFDFVNPERAAGQGQILVGLFPALADD